MPGGLGEACGQWAPRQEDRTGRSGSSAPFRARRASGTERGRPQEEPNGASIEGDHVSANRAFHLALVRPGGHITFQLMERLQIRSERYVHVHLEPLGRDKRASLEHREILGAWIRGDAPTVEALTAGHIRGTLSDLRQQLSN